MRLVPVEADDATVVESDNDMIRADGYETMWMFETEAAGQVGLAGVAEAILGSRSFAKVIWAQGDCVKVVGMVKDKKIEGVVLSGVGESYAGGSYGIWEAQVQNKIGVVRVGLFADISGTDAQDVVVFEDPPQESPR